MIPSRNWFPQSLQDRAGWYLNFSVQFAPIALNLGFTAPEIASMTADSNVMQFLASSTNTIDAYKDAARQYRIIVTEGDIGQPEAFYPPNLTLGPPDDVLPGMFERLDKAVKKIRAASTYTPEIGALLGIIPSKPDSIGEADLKPVIKASESFSNYKFTLNVTRLGQEAFKVQILRNGNGNWTDNGFATSNPFDVTVTPTTPGQPERVQVRAILLQKNEPVGQPSDPTYVTVNP